MKDNFIERQVKLNNWKVRLKVPSVTWKSRPTTIPPIFQSTITDPRISLKEKIVTQCASQSSMSILAASVVGCRSAASADQMQASHNAQDSEKATSLTSLRNSRACNAQSTIFSAFMIKTLSVSNPTTPCPAFSINMSSLCRRSDFKGEAHPEGRLRPQEERPRIRFQVHNDVNQDIGDMKRR